MCGVRVSVRVLAVLRLNFGTNEQMVEAGRDFCVHAPINLIGAHESMGFRMYACDMNYTCCIANGQCV